MSNFISVFMLAFAVLNVDGNLKLNNTSDVTKPEIIRKGSAAITTKDEERTHLGWKINLIVLAGIFVLAAIILVITWHLRDSIKIHNRIPKKILQFKMTDQRFSLNSIRQRFSLAISPKIGPSASKSRTSSNAHSPAPNDCNRGQETRNMGFMKEYTNGMKRDSWDVTRDSISGGPRSSWYQDTIQKEPRLATIHGSRMTIDDDEEPLHVYDGEYGDQSRIIDV